MRVGVWLQAAIAALVLMAAALAAPVRAGGLETLQIVTASGDARLSG